MSLEDQIRVKMQELAELAARLPTVKHNGLRVSFEVMIDTGGKVWVYAATVETGRPRFASETDVAKRYFTKN